MVVETRPAKKMSRKEARQREGLVDLAQIIAETLRPPYRTVVIVTDASGDFVGIGSNTSMQDAQNIMKCALYAQGLVFHDERSEKHSRKGDKRLAAVRGQSTPEKKE